MSSRMIDPTIDMSLIHHACQKYFIGSLAYNGIADYYSLLIEEEFDVEADEDYETGLRDTHFLASLDVNLSDVTKSFINLLCVQQPNNIQTSYSTWASSIKFLSEDQIVNATIKALSDDDKEFIAKTVIDENDMILLHHSLGRYIRNQFELWNPNNPYTDVSDTSSGFHPDNMSFRILKRIHFIVKGP